MKTNLAAAILVLALFAPGVHAGQRAAVVQAQAATTAWLVLTDSGRYGESWDEAATLFKAAVTQTDWERKIQAVRDPLGKLESRKRHSATFTRTLPGAPDGEYVVFRYATRFAYKASAVETVTAMHDRDGRWRVSGYFIK